MRKPRFEIRGEPGAYTFHLLASNGAEIMAGKTAYKTKVKASEAIKRAKKTAHHATAIQDKTGDA